MVKADEGKRPFEDNEPVKVKKVKTNDEHENEVKRSLEDSDDQKEMKKAKLISNDWGLGKGYCGKRISKYKITKEEFFDYISTHKALSTTNLLDIRGYGNTK